MFTENEKKYKAILANLLDVAPNDSAVLTKVDNKYNFDLFKLFGQNVCNEIYYKSNFEVDIIEEKLSVAADQIAQCTQADEVIEILNRFDIEHENKIKGLKRDFISTKARIIEELQKQFQKQSVKWKMFLTKAKEVNEQSNTWPIHIGFMFVKVKIEDKAVYGPLFLKEVNLVIENARPKLQSAGDIKPNEKLLFLLTNANFDFDTNFDISELSIDEVVKRVRGVWSKIYTNIPKPTSIFNNYLSEEIVNESVEFCPGMVLGLFQPSGGYIRNRMMQIIKNNELNSIFTSDFRKAIHSKRIDDYLFDERKSLFKITPTNYSQDKAIASSLLQNTLIWGPPGTGKSQTIVNLLANILVYKKTALVCSQKKAALDVILKRLGSLRIFCLPILYSRANANKKAFYKPLQQYIDFLEYFNEENKLKRLSIINKGEKDFVDKIGELKQNPRFDSVARILSRIKPYFEKLTFEAWNLLFQLPDILVYPEIVKFESLKDAQKWMFKNNKVQWSFFSQKRRKVSQTTEKIFNIFNNTGLNVSELTQIVSELEPDDFNLIKNMLEITNIKQNELISDENELKKYIATYIIERMENLTQQEKEQYTEFSSTIRTAKLEPYKFINYFTSLIKKMFPIVIITPEVDMSSSEKNEFDYAILDESSQIFVEKGLPVVYLAKTKVLAGDQEQMKPSNWFGIRVNDDETVYGMTESLLDFGQAVKIHNILLNKNYRSNHAALMTFSSKHFYNSDLDVIDSGLVESNSKPIEVIEANGVWENNQNLIETEIALNLTKYSLNTYEKIILLCFNSKQQEYLTKTIFEKYPELEIAMKNETLLLRNIENIQGDEADLVIAMVGYDKNATIHSTYVGRPGGKNALNVAISRAKDKMIVVKSLKSEDVKITTENENLYAFKKWLEFLELNDEQRKDFLNISKKRKLNSDSESQIEESELFIEIENYLHQISDGMNWISIHKHQTLGTINVDFLIKQNGQNAFVIIVDNFDYSGSYDKYLQFNDLCKFIEAKKYDLFKVSKLNWHELSSKIKEKIYSFTEIRTTNEIFEQDNESQTTINKIEEKNIITSVEQYENNLRHNTENYDILEGEEENFVEENNNTDLFYDKGSMIQEQIDEELDKFTNEMNEAKLTNSIEKSLFRENSTQQTQLNDNAQKDNFFTSETQISQSYDSTQVEISEDNQTDEYSLTAEKNAMNNVFDK
ncbi:putative DNA helicase [Mycoplasmopsis bovigenitalium]|uniref:Putative DNA helicase n=1 Tax=Mycoplasmopsis bovigenitalium TaxID=2112 RepID=A0A449A9D7_9BACT|nr:DEAD/DEAH box helicase [Mycoplasmopsis bovigenitalium]VEU60792.1 putative DNA helicase [Mycoplasmopsis bovigenitalium]